MIVYHKTKTEFLNDLDTGIATILNNRMIEVLGEGAEESEKESFRNSLKEVGKVLDDPDIPADCSIALSL